MHPFERWIFERGALIFSPSIRIKLAPFCTRYYFLIFNIKQTNKLLYIQYNKKVSRAKDGKGGKNKFERNIAGIRFLFARTMFPISEGSETSTVVAIFSTGRFFLRFFYHESEENHARSKCWTTQKIDRFATREIDLEEKGGVGGVEKNGWWWRLEELRSATSVSKKKKKKEKKRSCKGLMDYVTRTLIVAITVHKRKVVYIYIIIMTHKHMRISMRYLGCKVGNRS